MPNVMHLLFENAFVSVISFYLNFISTLFMFGLIWFVQIVHYPLFSKVGRKDFIQYQIAHEARTSFVVVLPMIIELLTSIHLYLLSQQTNQQTRIQELDSLFLIGLILTVLIWLSTFLFQMPMHKKLEDGFCEKSHFFLVRSNWIRTIFWSLRAIICLVISFIFTL